MKFVLIYNPKSGGRYTLRHLRALCRQHGHTISYSFTLQQLGSAKLRQLIMRGATVAVVGGDGTVNAVSRRLVGTKASLLPLPGGTFNHFVRDLGMSLNLEDTLASLKYATQRTVDVAYVNDELFLNNSSLGVYPFTLLERRRIGKIVGKWVAMVVAAVSQFGRFRRMHLIIDNHPVRSPFVFVGNNEYDISAALIPERRAFSKGILTVMVATSSSRVAFLRTGMAILRGNAKRRDDFILSKRKSVSVYSRRNSLPVSLDGEVRHLETPLEYRIAPKALRVLVVTAR
jgi:diacylglycerol kinase family enzyme